MMMMFGSSSSSGDGGVGGIYLFIIDSFIFLLAMY